MKSQAVNPYLPSYEYVPDGEPYVFGDRVYVFGSHEPYHGDDFCLLNYVGWSAPVNDLSDWRYEGIIYDRTKDPHYKPGNRLFAPDVQQGTDGRYYLYYSFDQTGLISVAVCDSPVGTYEYYGDVHYPDGTILGRKERDFFQYDPGVLVDDDKRVYLYSGFCFNGVKTPKLAHLPANHKGAMVIELEEDMVTVKVPPRFIVPSEYNSEGTGFEGHAFFEASSIRKIGKTYYFIYSSENGNELCYATSLFPDHGFTYGGTIVSNGDLGYHGRTTALNYTGTNHGSLVNIKGSWYVFYHRQTGGSAYSRQGCAEKIQILADGSIPQVQVTSQGLNGKALSAAPGDRYPAGIACCLMSASGALPYRPKWHVSEDHPWIGQDIEDIDPSAAGQCNRRALLQYVHNLRNDGKAGYRFFDLNGTAAITLSVCMKDAAGGQIRIMLGHDGQIIGELGSGKPERFNGECLLTIPLTFSSFSDTSPADLSAAEVWIMYTGDGSCDLLELIF